MENLIERLHTAHHVFCESEPHLAKVREYRDEIASRGEVDIKYLLKLACGGLLIMLIPSIFGKRFVLPSEDMTMILRSMLNVLFIALGVAVPVLSFFRRRRRIEELRRLIDRENGLAQDIFDACYDHISFIPQEYWNPDAADYFITVLSSRRVESLNEAYHLYDTYLHRMKIEQATQESIEIQKDQAKSLRSIRRSSRANAWINFANGFVSFVDRL